MHEPKDPGCASWPAVGEPYTAEDVIEVVRFLIQRGDGEYEALLARAEAAIRELADHGRPPGKLTLGERVAALEERINAFLGSRYCAFLTNATAGFEIAYRYADLKKGDEVIAPAITFIATIAYPLAVGARVVFADVDPRTLNMDPADVERKLTRRTRVIIPVHLGGWPVDMDPIMEVARRRDILVIEDAAHAFGSVYKGRKAGTIGHFGSFSFHEKKNINSFGEGGILTTELPFGEGLKQARFLGIDSVRKAAGWIYDVVALEGKRGPVVAGNYSSTEIQAVGLMLQLERLGSIIEERRRSAAYLNQRFAATDAIIPQLLDTEQIQSSHHLYLFQLDPDRAGGDIQILKTKLRARGVVNVPHFAPLYKFELLRRLGYDGRRIRVSCPAAEEAFNRRFTHLPLHGLSQGELERMADAVLESVAELRSPCSP